MIHLGLLTCSDFPDLTLSDSKLIPFLEANNLMVDVVIWNDPTFNANDYDVLIFRNTWDYFKKQETFFSWLNELKQHHIYTINSVEIIQWNLHKFYLKELQSAGFPVIPSIFISKDDNTPFSALLPDDWEKAVIKPAVSAGSYLTELFSYFDCDAIDTKYHDLRKNNDLIIQKFIPEITTQGEISVVFFDKKYSHAVIKTPKAGDFRIQSQFGGTYVPYIPDEALIESCSKIVQYIPQDLPYARVDGVMIDNIFHLMELELIEPDLYFDFVHDGHESFSKVIVKYIDMLR